MMWTGNYFLSLIMLTRFNSPFLLLDECTSNLDEQMTTTAIETIKKHCQIPYIVVIEHQVISGIFDHVEKNRNFFGNYNINYQQKLGKKK